MDNQNIGTASSNNYYNANYQAQPKKGKTIAVIVGILGVLLAVAIIIIAIVFANNTSTTTGAIVRENSPTLELYGKLDEEMTLGALQEEIEKVGATIDIDDGFGTIRFVDDSRNMIFFAIDKLSESNAGDESDDEVSYDEEYDSEGDYIPLTLEDYGPEDPVTYFRFAHTITEPTDSEYAEEENIGISFIEADEDDGTEAGYEVYDGYDFFLFPTKEAAIEAYLSPDTN